MVVTDNVKLSIGKALVKSSAKYPYIESSSRSFITDAAENIFVKKNLFGTEPNRWFTLCMVEDSLFRSTPLNHSHFSYQKFGVPGVEIQQGNRVPLAGTPLDFRNKVRPYYNTITGLGFTRSANGIKLDDFDEFFCGFWLDFHGGG